MSDDDGRERAAILARRNRFVTATLAGLAGVAGTTLATACPCLKMAPSQPEPSTNEAPEGDVAAPPPEEAKVPDEDAKADVPQR